MWATVKAQAFNISWRHNIASRWSARSVRILSVSLIWLERSLLFSGLWSLFGGVAANPPHMKAVSASLDAFQFFSASVTISVRCVNESGPAALKPIDIKSPAGSQRSAQPGGHAKRLCVRSASFPKASLRYSLLDLTIRYIFTQSVFGSWPPQAVQFAQAHLRKPFTQSPQAQLRPVSLGCQPPQCQPNAWLRSCLRHRLCHRRRLHRRGPCGGRGGRFGLR